LIVPDNANPFFAEIAKGVEDAGFEAGYSVMLCNSNKSEEREIAHLEMLQSKRVDGILISPASPSAKQVLSVIGQNIPVVVFYRDVGELDVDSFVIDNLKAGYIATQHLIDLGHTDIACIRPISRNTPSAQRVEGYLSAIADHGLEVNPNLLLQGRNDIESGKEVTQALIDSGQIFTAIVASNDAMAIGAVRALLENKINVPGDVSVVGIDNIALASYIEPPLTTVSQQKYETGNKAASYLIERIESKYKGGARMVNLELELIQRASSGPCKK